MNRSTIKTIAFLAALIFAFAPSAAIAQNLESTNYELIAPSVGSPVSGVVESSNFKQLYDSVVGAYTITSTTYSATGGTQSFVLANVPGVICFETNTNSGTTDCTGLPGADGMDAVCSNLGCYDRAKLEIDAQSNAADVRYAIQISTTSDFSANVYYVNPASRFPDTGPLDDTFFVPLCEWEGTIVSGVCASANTTYQRYNILGLVPDTLYYVRVSAHHGPDDDGYFTQSDWGPSTSATTQIPEMSLDVDIADDTSTPTNPPHLLTLPGALPNQVNTTTDMIVMHISTNLMNGLIGQVSGINGFLDHITAADQISSVSGDLGALTSGYGLRNDDSFSSADHTATIGDVIISSSPVDYTDTGATHKVGQVSTSKTNLLNTNNLPLENGIASFRVKVKPSSAHVAGVYQETLNFVLYGNL
jgi:hypothetical protein